MLLVLLCARQMQATAVSSSHSWANRCTVSECFPLMSLWESREKGFEGKWDASLCAALASCFSRTFIAHFLLPRKLASRSNGFSLLHYYALFLKLPSTLGPSHPRPRLLSSPLLFGSSPLLLRFLRRPARPLFPSDSELVRQEGLAVTLLSSSVPKYPPALSSVRRKTEEEEGGVRVGVADEPSREDGRMRRFKPRSEDINLDAAGGSQCDLCSLCRDAAAESSPTRSRRCFRLGACFPS